MAHDPKHGSLANKSQAWSALFSEPMSELVARYTASVPFDQRLAAVDIAGSTPGVYRDRLAREASSGGGRGGDDPPIQPAGTG